MEHEIKAATVTGCFWHGGSEQQLSLSRARRVGISFDDVVQVLINVSKYEEPRPPISPLWLPRIQTTKRLEVPHDAVLSFTENK